MNMGYRVGVMVRTLASHQCGPDSIPARCRLHLLLVCQVALKVFSLGTPVFFPPEKKLSKFQINQDRAPA